MIGLGSAPSAPFHGFAIFIDTSACIVFVIQHRVILPGDKIDPTRTKEKRRPVMVGNLKGAERSIVGNAQGRKFVYTSVLLELPRSDYVDDVSITFVAPLDHRQAAERVFRSLL